MPTENEAQTSNTNNTTEQPAPEEVVKPVGLTRPPVASPEAAPLNNASKEEEDAEPEVYSDEGYVPTGVAELDELTDTLKSAKVSFKLANAMLLEAFTNKDVNALDKEAFMEIVGKEKGQVAYMQAKLAIMATAAKAAKDTAELDKLAEGSWKELAEAAKKSIPKEDLADYQKLINQGGAARKLAIKEIKAHVKGLNPSNKTLVSGDGGTSVLDNTYINATQYRSKMYDIEAKYSRAGMLTSEGREKMKALDNLRIESMRAGVK